MVIIYRILGGLYIMSVSEFIKDTLQPQNIKMLMHPKDNRLKQRGTGADSLRFH